jgi:hypothetical protein
LAATLRKSAKNMDHKIYNWITTPLIFGVWFYIAISGIKAYLRLGKMKGISPFMFKRDLEAIKDPETIEALKKWKLKARKLFLLWLITVIFFFVLSMTIDRTIGFKD